MFWRKPKDIRVIVELQIPPIEIKINSDSCEEIKKKMISKNTNVSEEISDGVSDFERIKTISKIPFGKED